jgi:hypothetical protein
MPGAELTDDVIANLTEEQVTVLQELGELASKKFQVSSAIQEFTDQVTGSQRTMGFQTKSNPEALHEDPEIVTLVTIRERHKLGGISVRIQRMLRRAVDMGLGHLALIQRQCHAYGIDCSSDGEKGHKTFSDPDTEAPAD